MENKFYTIEEIAELLGMHHKTIRKFITEGKLSAGKVGKQWRISGHDLSVFMENNHVRMGSENKNESLEIDYSATGSAAAANQRVTLSTVADIKDTDKNEYIRISNTLIALANCKDPETGGSTIQMKYDEKDQRMRIILWGNMKFIEIMLNTISILVENGGE